MSEILNEDASFSMELTEESTMQELDQYVRGCVRKHPYGYGFTPDMPQKFEAVGALNMYNMQDYVLSCKDLLEEFKSAEGIATPSGLAAPARTITPVHLEDNSK